MIAPRDKKMTRQSGAPMNAISDAVKVRKDIRVMKSLDCCVEKEEKKKKKKDQTSMGARAPRKKSTGRMNIRSVLRMKRSHAETNQTTTERCGCS
jgi:hypothetical protein